MLPLKFIYLSSILEWPTENCKVFTRDFVAIAWRQNCKIIQQSSKQSTDGECELFWWKNDSRIIVMCVVSTIDYVVIHRIDQFFATCEKL